MQTKNEYRIPELKELALGFKFEYNGHYTHVKSDWTEYIVKENWYSPDNKSWDVEPSISFFFWQLKQHPENFRVKI